MALDNPIDAALSPRATQILGGADALLPDPTSSVLQTTGATSPTTDLLGALGGDTSATSSSGTPLPAGVTDLANSTILGFHQALETTADQNALIGTVHGLTNLGETVGLGKIGGTNLVTEALTAPTALASGDTSVVSPTVSNVAAIGNAASGLVNGAAADTGVNSSAVHPLGDVVTQTLDSTTSTLGGLGATVGGAASGNTGIDGVLNQTVDALAPTVGLVGGSIAHDTTAGLLNVTNAIGLGDIGGQNLLSDLGHLPSSLLAGDTTPLTDIPGDLGSIGTALSGTLEGLGNDIATSTILGTLTHPTTGAGILGGTLPGQGITGGLVSQVDNVVNEGGMRNGIEPVTQAVTGVTDGLLGGSSPVSNILHDLGGGADSLSSLPADLGSTIGSLSNVVSSVAGELPGSTVLGDVIGPVAGLFGGQGGLGVLPTGGTSGPIHDVTAPVDGLLNQAVDGLTPTVGAVAGSIAHDTTGGLLDTLSAAGLGDLGGHNLITDLVQAPAGTLGGDTTSLTNLPGDLASVANGLAATVAGLGSDTASSTILGAVTHLTDGGQPGSAVPGLSAVLNDVAPQVDNLVNTVGMLNGIQPITSAATDATGSVLHLPDAITSGGLASVPADLGSTIGSVGDVVSSVAGQLPGSSVLGDVIGPVSSLSDTIGVLPTGGTNGPIHDVTAPVDSLLNQTVNDLAPTVSTVAGSIAHDTTGGLLDTASAAGLGDLGGHNLVTDLAQAPAGVLGGDTTSLANLPGDLGTVASGLATTVDGLGNDTTTSTILGAVTHLADGGQPGGAVPGLSTVLGDVAPQVSGLVDGGGASGALGTVTGALSGAGGSSPLGTVTNLLGDATGTSSSGHAVATLSAGPQSASSGVGVDVLSNAGGQTQLVDTHTGTTAAPSATVASVGVLSDGSFHFPTVSGGGSDALSGALQSVTAAVTPAAAGDAHGGIDLGVVHVDLPVAAAHADPLASLAHAVPHV